MPPAGGGEVARSGRPRWRHALRYGGAALCGAILGQLAWHVFRLALPRAPFWLIPAIFTGALTVLVVLAVGFRPVLVRRR